MLLNVIPKRLRSFPISFLNSRNISPILLLLVYLPPSSSRYSVSANELSACIDSLLNSLISEHSISLPHFCVLGDFNLPKSQWKTLSSSVDYELHVLDILSNHFLIPIIINTPTHIANNVLDNILVSDPSLFNLLSIDSVANISDHYPIIFECIISEQLVLVSSPLQYNFNNLRSLNNFRSYWQPFDYSNHPSSTVEEFYLHLHNAIALTLVKKRTKRVELPYYYTSHTVHCYNRLETLKRRCIRNPTNKNLTNLNSSQKDFDNFAELDRITLLHGSTTHLISESFKLLRSLSSQTLPQIKFRGDNYFNSVAAIVNGFNDFFAENFNLQHFDDVVPPTDCSLELDGVLDTFSPCEIVNFINNLKSSTSPTNDGFPTRLLKLHSELFGKLPHPVFRSVVLTRIFPAEWKVSHILPLYKDGPKNCIENYRPISLLPKVSLIFERILFNYIYLAIKDKLHPKQFGFQAKRGAVLQLLDYLETIYRHSSSILFAVYLDYAKAFDKVPYAVLLKKLHTFGMDLNFISLMRSYLLDRTQKASAQGQLSNALPVLSGVPQGSVLGPLLFLLFINDLPAIFLDAIPWLFADDLKLLFNTANFHDDSARLHNWNLSKGMLANTAKTKTQL